MNSETAWSQNQGQIRDSAKVVSITEAARINNVTRQAIYVAIKQKKLKATKDSTRWTIHLDDLDEYRKNKYSRTKSMFDGELLFDNRKGYYSVNQAAKLLGARLPAAIDAGSQRCGVRPHLFRHEAFRRRQCFDGCQIGAAAAHTIQAG